MEVVIFDTNIARNPDPRTFLGGRQDLQKFSKYATLIFPEIVIEEIKAQKTRKLLKEKSLFIKNNFHWILNIDEKETRNFDNDTLISSLENDESIKYQIIKLTNSNALPKMKELAIKKLPPFEESDKSDKGFKDAYIYFTILEYLESNPKEKIFVCTGDGRLKDALLSHKRITVIKDFDEFREKSISLFQESYFIEKLQNEVDENITQEDIQDFWENINENQVLLIKLGNGKIVVEVDSGEITESKSTSEYDINDLINSSSFKSTHNAVAILDEFKQFFSDDEITMILQAVVDNLQIQRIVSDDDIKQFITTLYDAKKDILDKDLRDHLYKLLDEKSSSCL